MSEDTNLPEYDTNRVAELIGKHRAATTRREQREIENEILEATVWGDGDQLVTATDEYVMSRADLKVIYKALREADASEEVKMIARKPFVKNL